MYTRFHFALAALLAAPALTTFAQTTNCNGRFIDGIGIPGVPNNSPVRASIEWDPDGPGPAKPLLVIAATTVGAGYSFGGGVFAFDGIAWRPIGVGLGLNAQVTSLAVFRGELFAAGNFVPGERPGVTLNGLARWDGAVWQPVPGNPAKSIASLFVYEDELVISSVGNDTFTIEGQNIGGAAAFDGSAWHGVGIAPTFIRCFANYNGDLIAGGLFTTLNGTPMNGLARWNGVAWQPLGTPTPGANGAVIALEIFGTDLIAGGEFTAAGGVPAANIARWSGTQWSPLSDSSPTRRVQALLRHDGKLYVGGDFNTIGAQQINKLAIWDGATWAPAVLPTVDVLSQGTISYPVTTLAAVDGQLFAGGAFRGVDYAGFGNGLGGFAAVPPDPTSRYGRLSSFEGMYLAGFAKYQSNLYGYGILGNDDLNHNTPSIARLIDGTWQPVTGSLTPAYVPGSDTLIGRLRATAEYQGKLVFVGTFNAVDGVAARCVAAFDGSHWTPVVPNSAWPVSLSLYSVEAFEDSLVLGGTFANAATAEGTATNIVRWDGTQLHSMGAIAAQVRVLRNLEGQLYAGTATDAYLWNGTAWAALRSAANVGIKNVHDFRIFNGMLLAEADGRVTRWDGTAWINLNSGALPESGGLIEYKGRLFRFGDIPSSTQGFNARSWDGTRSWTPLGISRDYQLTSLTKLVLTCAIEHEGMLYLGGFAGKFSSTGIDFDSPKGIIVSRYTTDTLPRFEGEPTNQIFTLNHEARLQASLQAGAERPSIVSFQWQRNGAPIANGATGASPGGGTVQGATSATLHIFGVQPSDAGNYTLIATSSCGTQTSASGELKVRLIPQDINADGFVNDADFELFVQQYDVMVCDDPSMPDGCSADFNADGVVDDADFALFIPAYEALFADGR